MSRIAVFLTGIVLTAAGLSGGTDLSGKYAAVLSTIGRDVKLYLELSQTGEAVTGAAGTRSDFLSPLTNVRLSGKTLSFDLTFGAGARFEGLAEAGRLAGQLTSDVPRMNGRLEATRTGPPSLFPKSVAADSGGARLAALSDEFDDPATLAAWKRMDEVEGWPARIEKIDVNRTSPGHMMVIPRSGAWWAGYHGVYLFKEVKGDFAISTRVKVTGRTGGDPSRIWTISGLLVRAGADPATPPELRKENWVYLMTGRGPAQARVVDAKSTIDGLNAFDITPTKPGWLDLRIARVGPLFVFLTRPEDGPWVIRKRVLRPDLPETVQAGINVTSDFDLSGSMPPLEYNTKLFPDRSNPDSVTLFDYIRFSPIRGVSEFTKAAGRNILSVSDSELLPLLE